MQPGQRNILFAGGGTGGHLFPGIAIAEEIRAIRPDIAIGFAGTRDRIEARVVPARGFGFSTIWISGFRRRASLSNLLVPLKIVVALVQSLAIIFRRKPGVVVGTGGYVCGPVVFAASLLGVPTLIQEQNSYPGITTRLLASRASEVHLTFERSKKYLKRVDNVRVTGNPTRREIGSVTRQEGARVFGLDAARRTLLVFGGSLGARSINTAVLTIVEKLEAMGLQIIWQAGDEDSGRVNAELKGNHPAVKVQSFIEKMEYAYAAADLALCRSGATTVAELCRAGVPAVLVPYPFAAADHQTENARAMVEAGAATMIRDGELRERLLETIGGLYADPQRLAAMKAHAVALGKPGAAVTIARAVLALMKE